MTQPALILDQHFRTVDELFRKDVFEELGTLVRIIGGEDGPMDPSRIDALIEEADFLVAARPALTGDQVRRAAKLKAVVEVSGAFHGEADYGACLEAGIEVLSCVPGFRESVAEMTLAMILAGGRGLVDQHEAFRGGTEAWLDDLEDTDFTLFRQDVGFVGYGNISRETHRLMRPFFPVVRAFDPWIMSADDVEFMALDDVLARSRVVVVAATPTKENRHMIGARELDLLPPGALVVLISRAHCVDFDALCDAASAGRLRAAIDVFPSEPLDTDARVRSIPNVILSPHRAAAVPGGRQLIGDMVLHDIKAILEGRLARQLKPADPAQLDSLVAAQKTLRSLG